MSRTLRAVLFLLLLFTVQSQSAPVADQADRFYDPASLQTIDLEISPDNLRRLREALPDRITVPGTFRWNGQTIERVGIRYKGNSSSNPQAPFKRAFLVSFGEFEKNQRFIGLRNVALDNGIQFGSLFSEPLITETLRSLGVKASRCNYARLNVNGQYQGVYINVERIDRSFLERNFGADEGILFKVDEGGPGADLRYLGPDSGVYTRAFELHAGEKREASRRLLELLKAVNGVRDAGAAPQEVSTILDTDAFLTTTAVMLFAGAFDQYTGWGPHNYYLYRDPSNGRWTYIPWDLDVGFADRAFDRVPVIEGWNAAWPAPVPERPLMEWLVTHDDALKAYRAKASVILETRFRPDIVLPKLQALHRLIADDLARDPFPPVRITNPTDRGYADILTSMETFIRKRYTLARAQLDNPGARPRNDDGPRPGPDSADAPAGLRAVRVTSSSVELSWTDRANGEVAVVLQRANSADSDDFVNTIGQPGENITTAIDRDVRPGRVYRYRVYAVFPTSQGPRGSGVSNTITVTIPDR